MDPNSPSAAKEWKHWLQTFTNFIEECGEDAPDKYRTLINYISHNVYEFIEDCSDYESSIETLNRLYVKPPNEISSRHLLATRCQKPGETLAEFLTELRRLSKDCNVKSVTADQYREELIRDSFISGLLSPLIRQRLLENKQLDLKTAFDQAYALDLAQKNSEAYAMPSGSTASVSTPENTDKVLISSNKPVTSAVKPSRKCYFCGGPLHNRKDCPARNCGCSNCGKSHFAKVCQSKPTKTAASLSPSILCLTTAACPESLMQSSIKVTISDVVLTALIDSGS